MMPVLENVVVVLLRNKEISHFIKVNIAVFSKIYVERTRLFRKRKSSGKRFPLSSQRPVLENDLLFSLFIFPIVPHPSAGSGAKPVWFNQILLDPQNQTSPDLFVGADVFRRCEIFIAVSFRLRLLENVFDAISLAGFTKHFPKAGVFQCCLQIFAGKNHLGYSRYSLVFDRGSLGPSTVTLIAFRYVQIIIGLVLMVIVKLNDFPENN